jgi:hypothetical protein
VLWGGLHGLYLVINHGWQRIVPPRIAASRLYVHLAWGVTFFAVVLAWVPFRAPTIEGAGRILAGMAGANGVSIPNAIAARLGGAGQQLLDAFGVEASLGGGSQFALTWFWIAALFAIARFAPNTQELMASARPALGYGPAGGARLRWRPSAAWALSTGTVTAVALLALSQVSEFLYFQF